MAPSMISLFAGEERDTKRQTLRDPLAVLAKHIDFAAILLPAGFFLSVASPDARAPSPLIYLAFAGAVVLAVALITVGVGLLRRHQER